MFIIPQAPTSEEQFTCKFLIVPFNNWKQLYVQWRGVTFYYQSTAISRAVSIVNRVTSHYNVNSKLWLSLERHFRLKMHVSCRTNSILTDVLDNTVTGGHFMAEKWHERGEEKNKERGTRWKKGICIHRNSEKLAPVKLIHCIQYSLLVLWPYSGYWHQRAIIEMQNCDYSFLGNWWDEQPKWRLFDYSSTCSSGVNNASGWGADSWTKNWPEWLIIFLLNRTMCCVVYLI